MVIADADLIALFALQHYLFCPRRDGAGQSDDANVLPIVAAELCIKPRRPLTEQHEEGKRSASDV
jgi:hypothetical protein